MTDDDRNHEALFRHAILGDLLSRNLRRGQLRPALKQLAQQSYQDHHGRSRRVAYKTLEEWYSAEQIVLRSQGTIAVEVFLTINNIAGPKSSTSSA